jgi:hypothetical protein
MGRARAVARGLFSRRSVIRKSIPNQLEIDCDEEWIEISPAICLARRLLDVCS